MQAAWSGAPGEQKFVPGSKTPCNRHEHLYRRNNAPCRPQGAEHQAKNQRLRSKAPCSRHEEAQTVFDDDLATIRTDVDHSVGESREIIAGMAESGRLLLVSFTSRGEAIRIINARELTRSERKAYEEERA